VPALEDDGVDTALARLLLDERAVGLDVLQACLQEVRTRRGSALAPSLADLLQERGLLDRDSLADSIARLNAPAPQEEAGSRPKELGPYRLDGEIARGGMGAVYEAVHTATGIRYALKTLHPGVGGSDSSEEIARFIREAEVMAKLDHPHVARIHAAEFDGPTPYLVQDLLAGGTLADRIDRESLSVEESLQIALKLALGLQHCHEHGVLHRDLKPANVLFNDLDEPTLVDFGLAYVSNCARRLTQTGSVMGTPGYMAPEQARGDKALDERTDVYGLGAVLYAMLTGRPPFQGAGLFAVLDKVLHHSPELPSLRRPHIPAGVERVCLKALSKDPAERFESAEVLARALANPGRDSAPWGVRAFLALVLVALPLVALGAVFATPSSSSPRPTPSRSSAPGSNPTVDPQSPSGSPSPPATVGFLGKDPEEVFNHLDGPLLEHFGSPVGASAYHAAGVDHVLTWGRSQEVRDWQVGTAQADARRISLRAVPVGLLVAPNQSSFYVTYPTTARLERISLSTGRVTARIPLPAWTTDVLAMALSPDGKTVALALLRSRASVQDTVLCLLDSRTGELALTRRLRGLVPRVVLSTRRLVAVVNRPEKGAARPEVVGFALPLTLSTSDAKWNRHKPTWRAYLPVRARVRSVAVSADDRYVAVGCDRNELFLIDGDQQPLALKRKDSQLLLGAHSAPVWGVAFYGSPPALLSGSGDPTAPTRGAELVVWDLLDPGGPKELRRIARPHAIKNLAVLARRSLLVVSRRDAAAELWRLGSH
jgi:serine/threonine protein kinase